MNLIAKTLLATVTKYLPIKQIVAGLLCDLLNKAIASKDPAKIAEVAKIADCSLEGATVLVAVCQKLAEALKDGTITSVEADAIIATAKAAFEAWAKGDSTPDTFKALWRSVTGDSAMVVGATPAPSV